MHIRNQARTAARAAGTWQRRFCAQMTNVRAGAHTAESFDASLAGSATPFSFAITGIFLALRRIDTTRRLLVSRWRIWKILRPMV